MRLVYRADPATVQARIARLMAAGLCIDCRAPADSGKFCTACRKRRNEAKARHREKVAKARDAAKLCRRCGDAPQPDDGTWCEGCRLAAKLTRIARLDEREAASAA